MIVAWGLWAWLGSADAGQLTLVGEGEGEKSTLVYALDGKVRQAVTASIDMAVTVSMNGTTRTVAVPTYELDLALVGSQQPDGLIRATWRCTAVHVADDALTADTAAVAEELRKMKRAKGEITFGPDGLLVRQSSNLADILGGEASIDSAPFEIARSVIVLPSVPVGVGASWVYADRLPMQGVEIEQDTQYTLVGLEGRVATLDVVVTQRVPQGATLEGEGGVSLTIREFQGGGTGKTTLDLGALVGPSASSAVDVVMDVQGTAMGVTLEMSQALRMRMQVNATTPSSSR
jgi:hypothetical protein